MEQTSLFLSLPEEHQARAIWDILERLDLSIFYASVPVVEGGPGRPANNRPFRGRAGNLGLGAGRGHSEPVLGHVSLVVGKIG